MWVEDAIRSEYRLRIVDCGQQQTLGNVFLAMFNLTYAHQRNADLRQQLTCPEQSTFGMRFMNMGIRMMI